MSVPGCHNQVPQTGWLGAAEICSLTVQGLAVGGRAFWRQRGPAACLCPGPGAACSLGCQPVEAVSGLRHSPLHSLRPGTGPTLSWDALISNPELVTSTETLFPDEAPGRREFWGDTVPLSLQRNLPQEARPHRKAHPLDVHSEFSPHPWGLGLPQAPPLLLDLFVLYSWPPLAQGLPQAGQVWTQLRQVRGCAED